MACASISNDLRLTSAPTRLVACGREYEAGPFNMPPSKARSLVASTPCQDNKTNSIGDGLPNTPCVFHVLKRTKHHRVGVSILEDGIAAHEGGKFHKLARVICQEPIANSPIKYSGEEHYRHAGGKGSATHPGHAKLARLNGGGCLTVSDG